MTERTPVMPFDHDLMRLSQGKWSKPIWAIINKDNQLEYVGPDFNDALHRIWNDRRIIQVEFREVPTKKVKK